MPNPVCQCHMFKRLGTCWHTGYRPKAHKPIPIHERRRRDFLAYLKELRPNDPDV